MISAADADASLAPLRTHRRPQSSDDKAKRSHLVIFYATV
jgi:hypothetical protein